MDEAQRAPYLAALRAADRGNLQELTRIWVDRLSQYENDSVQNSMRVAMWNLPVHVQRIANFMLGNPLSISVHVDESLATVRGKLVWPKVASAELVAGLR